MKNDVDGLGAVAAGGGVGTEGLLDQKDVLVPPEDDLVVMVGDTDGLDGVDGLDGLTDALGDDPDIVVRARASMLKIEKRSKITSVHFFIILSYEKGRISPPRQDVDYRFLITTEVGRSSETTE